MMDSSSCSSSFSTRELQISSIGAVAVVTMLVSHSVVAMLVSHSVVAMLVSHST